MAPHCAPTEQQAGNLARGEGHARLDHCHMPQKSCGLHEKVLKTVALLAAWPVV